MVSKKLAVLLGLFTASNVVAQEVYLLAQGPSSRPTCPRTNTPEPTYRFTQFSYTQTETYRTATPRPSPMTTHKYAPPYAALSSLVPNLTTTTWGNWNPNDTVKPTDTANPYGNAAWSALWVQAELTNFTTTGRYSTTVSPTPVPTSELILPPADYFGPTDCYTFPDDFFFGVAGSASQIEGAVASEGKSPNLLDKIAASGVFDNDYVADENYFLYKQDIERLAAIGVEYYSFSIPWARILPFALPGTPVNQHGIDHYNDLINFVLEKGMIPTVTMIHFDTPLQFYGGPVMAPGKISHGPSGAYENATFPDAFVNYGKILLTHFGDRVPIWFTFNEPYNFVNSGPSVYNVLKSHARLYHFYKEEMRGTGQMGFKLSDNFGVPADPKNASHLAAAKRFNEIQLGMFGNPIFLGIDYPETYKSTVTDFVPLTPKDLAYIGNTSDFLGIDPYTNTVITPLDGDVQACTSNSSSPLWPLCVIQSNQNVFGWNVGYRSQSYVYTTPKYLRSFLNYLWNTWRTPILISEFGFMVHAEAERELKDQLFDSPRSQYYLSFMSEVLKSIHEDHVKVIGALAWSFVDNWEGLYINHFGLQTVNRTTQERRYKKSFFDLVDFVTTRTRPKKARG